MKEGWTSVFNLKSSAIADCHLLFLLEGLLNLQILKLVGDMSIGTTVSQSLFLLIGGI
jgi:hypothetical protein